MATVGPGHVRSAHRPDLQLWCFNSGTSTRVLYKS